MSFTLKFKPDHPAVQSKGFEERLALRLLDIIYGREGACFPDPVPLKHEGSNMRMIGASNDTWLKREDATTFTVMTRYKTPETDEAMASAEKLIRQQYEDLLVFEAPILPPPVETPKPETFDARLATAMKPVKTVSFRALPKVTKP